MQGADRRALTREEIEATFSAEKAANDGLLSSRVYRRVSFWATPWFVRAGISANAVTLLAMVVCLALPVAALWLGAHGYIAVAVLAFSFLVLDCVDGNIARLQGASSPLGQFFDSTAGKLYAITRTLALAILAGHEWPEIAMSTWVAGGLFAVLLFIWGRESRQYFKIVAGGGGDHFVAGKGWLKDAALGAPELIPPGLLLLGPLGLAWLLFAGLCLFYAGLFAYTQQSILRALLR